MKTRSFILMILLGFMTGVYANDDVFRLAQEAYDDARYAEAALLYEGLLSNGVANAELYYNLGNASFKDGDLPAAVRHYRKAWYEKPRDPDIRANLRFAQNAAGAIEPAASFAERIFYSLSLGEWIIALTAGYGLLCLLLMLSLLIPGGRRFIFKLCLLPVALILISTGGWREWRQLNVQPEWVVVKTDATALYGPVDGSTAHYKVPLGALVRQHATDPKGWVGVVYDGKQGWLKAEYIMRVSP